MTNLNDFVPVKGYEDLYLISREGEIYSLITHKIMSPFRNSAGYECLRLTKDKKFKHKSIHRLLAEAFIPNPENKPCIDHIDGNPRNNSLSNLRWCTVKENSNNPITKWRNQSLRQPWPKMSEDAIRKRSTKSRKPVVQFSRDGKYIKTWDCIKEAADALHISQGRIGEVCRGERFSIGGFIFRYADKNQPDPNKSTITVDAFPAHQFGSEPLIKVTSKDE